MHSTQVCPDGPLPPQRPPGGLGSAGAPNVHRAVTRATAEPGAGSGMSGPGTALAPLCVHALLGGGFHNHPR